MSDATLQADIQRFGRLYVASSHVSHAVVRSRCRQELLDQVVRLLVDVGEFAMALVSWHDPASGELLPGVRYGDLQGYAERIHMFADETPEGQGPGGTAFRQGVPYVCNDILNDPSTLPWREAAHASGWRASAAFPIPIAGAPRGLLSVYAREAGIFGPDQVELLRQVTLDVAFGLEHLDDLERRRHAEAALSAGEHRLKMAMDAAALGTFDWDLRSGQIVWDGHTEGIFGFEPGGFDGAYASFERCIHPEDLPRLNRAVALARDSRAVFSPELRIVWPDGSEHWILARGEFHFSESGRPHRMYGAVLDITERKRVETALRESEEMLRQAVRVTHIGIFDHDHLTGKIYWSPEQRAMHGLGPDIPVTLDIYIERIHPEDRPRIAAAVKRAHNPTGDGLFDVEHRLLLPDGSVRWTSTRSQTFFEGAGDAQRPVRTVGAITDITNQKRAAEAQQKLAAVVAMSRDFVGIATLEGQVVYLNQAGMDMVGLRSIEEACRKTIFDFVPDADLARVRDQLYPALFDVGYWSGESHLRHFQSGSLIDVEITAFQVRDEHNAPINIATVTRDITEKRRAAAEKAALEGQLFQAQKMESVGRLAGGVAHDFNNLLTVINGYSQLLLSNLHPTDPLVNSLREIYKAGERAAGLTRQLLAFSRKQVLEPRMLDVNLVLESMRPLLERLVGEDVAVRVAPEARNATVYGDPHQLQQVIMNLAVNARDAMPKGGKLLLQTANVVWDQRSVQSHPEERPGAFVMLAVTDNGSGMDDETRQRIFEPFFTTKPVGEGTGLGLSTVQGIVAQSGGYINVNSAPGLGTTFKIYLPARSEAVPDTRAPVAAPVLGGSETILVVEDQAEVRRFAVKVLQSYGYRVLAADGAVAALEYCRQESGPVHLLLTDVVMPLLSGRDLARQLSKLRPGIKVLFMSGYIDPAVAGRNVLDEGARFIGKPFTPEALAAKVRGALGPAGD
jgi:PAS domain S-box-containing protein